MNIRKYIAQTARQALRDIRNELGEDAVILSNRQVEQGVEIVALANDAIAQLTNSVAAQGSKRELRGSAGAVQKTAQPSSRPVAQVKHLPEELPQIGLPVDAAQFVSGHDNILDEVKSMYSMLQQQFAALSWNDVRQRDPQSAGMLRRMLNSGFSALLARQLLDKMPAEKTQREPWIRQVLKHNLHVAGEADDIIAKGGAYALIGPTGVGKTTTTAKLAARAVVRYGADKVVLLTTDSYRIGAYEQLKIYGRILGVAVHAVKDTDDLRLTLSALRHKHLVLIDTVGMGQRDERVGGQNEMFDAAGVERLLLLNATSGGDTLEDVVRMYRSRKVIGCVVTKLDEAANLGAVLDVAVRHRLVLHYMANGQRVPEDLHPINLDYLLHRALKPAEEKTPFTLNEMELPVLMAVPRPPEGRESGGTPLTGGSAGGVNSAQPKVGGGLPAFGVLLAGAGTPSGEPAYAL